MTCPHEIAEILSGILSHGILQIRAKAWNEDSQSVAELADHIHNLPMLLIDFSPEKLSYYWETERTIFFDRVENELSAPYADMWNRLESFVPATDVGSRIPASQRRD